MLKNTAPAETQTPPFRPRAMNRRNWKQQFLAEFAKVGIIAAACRAIGISRDTVIYARRSSPKFEAQFQKALATANEVLEMHAMKLATVGQDDPIFMRDKDNNPVKVFDRKRQSEKILQMLLSARMPEKYRQNITQELVGPGGVPLAAPITPVNCTFILPPNNRGDPAHRALDAEVKELPPVEPEKT